MKIVSLKVESFGQLANHTLEFGDHLNVVYAPNGFGKSTLADAIRAALLLQHTSAEHKKWIPWGTQDSPKVELVFQPEPMRFLRVKKTFGAGGSALLEQSKDNISYSKKASGRSVDGEIRNTLRWGIPEPGKGASRGLPNSFLTSVLLPTQDDVMSVLSDGIAQDKDETGKQLLNEALQAMATDPAFSEIMRKVQERVDEAFTGTGRKRTGQASPFRAISEEIKRVDTRVQATEKDFRDSQSVQQEIAQLHSKLTEEKTALEESSVKVERMRQLWNKLQKAKQATITTKEKLDKLQAKHSEIDALADEIKQANEAAKKLQAQHAQAKAAVQSAQAECDAALQQQRQATSDDAIAQKKIRKQEIEKQLLVLNAELKQKEQEKKELAVRAKTLEQYEDCRKKVENLEAEAKEIAKQTKENASLLHAVSGMQAWQEAESAKRRVQQLTEKVQQLELLRSEKGGLETKLHEIDEQNAKTAVLPSNETLDEFSKLERDIELARAKTTAHLNVQINPQQALDLEVSVDGAELEKREIADATEISAALSMVLNIPGIAKFSVKAGDPVAARRLADLQAAWSQDVTPVLQQSGVNSLADLRTRRTATNNRISAKKELVESLKRLDHQIQASTGAETEIVEAKKKLADAEREYSEFDEQQLAHHLALLAPRPAEEQQQAIESLRNQAQEQLVYLSGQEAKKKQQLESEQCTLVTLESSTSDWPDVGKITTQQNELDTLLISIQSSLNEKQIELDGIVSADDRLETIDSRIENAKVQLDERAAKLKTIEEHLATAKEGRDKKEGELKSQQRDFPADELKTAKQNYDETLTLEQSLESTSPNLNPSLLEEYEQHQKELQAKVSATNAALLQKQGGLKQVAGDIARERFQQEKQALQMKKQQEEELELEYEGYRLLLETLREAENSEASHLGQAIADPISERLSELTHGLFDRLELGPSMDVQGIMVHGETRDLDRLSLGTQEQISTLMRLSVAAEMESVLVLDDQLTQSDPIRMEWFQDALRESSKKHQIIVFTCRPEDYAAPYELAGDFELSSNLLRTLDLTGAVKV